MEYVKHHHFSGKLPFEKNQVASLIYRFNKVSDIKISRGVWRKHFTNVAFEKGNASDDLIDFHQAR